MPINLNDPIKSIIDGLCEKLPEEWINGFCHILQMAIKDKHRKYIITTTPILTIQDNFAKYLSILDEILPSLPKEMEEMFHTQYEIIPNESKYEFDFLVIDKLTSKIFKYFIPFFADVMYYGFASDIDDAQWILMSVTRKILFYSSKKTLQDNYDIIKDFLFSLTHTTHFFCNALSHLFIETFFILIEKLPKDICNTLFTSNIIFHANFFSRQSHLEDECVLLGKLKAWYQNNECEKIVKSNPSSIAVFDINQKLQSSVETALDMFIDLVDQDSFDLRELSETDIFVYLNGILSNPNDEENAGSNIKMFLTKLLKFRVGPDFNYSWDGSSFMKLVQLIINLRDLIAKQFVTMYENVEETSCFYVAGKTMKFIYKMLNILQALYILNHSWYHWFDIIDASNIIDCEILDRIFNTKCFNHFLITMRKYGEEFYYQFKSCCPISSINIPKFQLKYSVKTFTISRSDVLLSFQKLFEKDNSKHVWSLMFKSELGQGNGPTKEAYTLLCQELQNYELNLFQGNPIQKNGISLINSENGLFPKKSENIKLFYFLGQLLAKAYIDNKQLDLPLNEDFFRHLCESHYSYLGKDYYNIPNVFPITKELIRQLISFKRKKEIIQSECAYTESQKREIIKNLTLDDGSCFDDLCLNFTIPGTDVELIEGGSDIILSPFNFEEYLKELCDEKFFPTEQFQAIKDGFVNVLGYGALKLFVTKEFYEIICGKQLNQWTIPELESECKVTEDYVNDSKPVKFLFQILASFDHKDQTAFLKFVTGLSNLPTQGLSGLVPPLTISKFKRNQPDNSLPTASTCFNHLYLPAYSSLDITKEKLLLAINEGNDSFQFV